MKLDSYGSISVPGRVNSGRLKALSNLGQQVGDLGFDLVGRQRAKLGKIKGAEAGIAAAESGEAPQEQQDLFPTLFGESFNNAQQAAYLASIDRKAVERLSELEDEHSTDPEAYNANAKALLSGLVENAPETYKGALNNSISNYISSGNIRVNRNLAKKGREEAKSELSGAIDTYSREASRAARNGDFDQMDDLLNKASLSAGAMVESGFWKKEQAAEVVSGLRKEIFRQENKRDILETAESNPAKAFKTLTDLEKSVPETFSPDEWERVVDDIRTDLNRLMPAKSSGTNKEGNDWLKRAKESLRFGFKLSEADKAEGAALLSGTEKQDDFNRLMKMEQFSLLSSTQRNAVLNQLSAANTLDSQKDYIELQAVHNYLTKMAEDDGMSLAKRQGRLEPASLSDMAARNNQAEALSELYGTKVGPYMESEIQEFVASMEDMSPTEKADFAMSFGANERTYQQLDKKNASMFAMISARQDRDLANAVFRGQDLIQSKQFKLPPRADYLETANEVLGEAGEVYGIEDRATIIKTALNYYATLGEEAYDDNMFEKALMAVTGGIGEINGRKVELPPEVSEDDLEDFMDDLQPETLLSLGGLLHPFPIEDVRDAQLVSVGSGSYQLEIGGLRQYNKNREPFEINVTPELILLNNANKPSLESVRKIRRGR